MKIAFYAPMKSPCSPRPSGDRRIARLFMAALQTAGFEPQLASAFRSWEGKGNPDDQRRIEHRGKEIADQLIRTYLALPQDQRPRAWFTYHLYYKAPDWIGPAVCDALDIPYLVAEASIAPRQATGRWQHGHHASVEAIRGAGKIFTINPIDSIALRQTLDDPDVVMLTPFLDQEPVKPDTNTFQSLRTKLSRQYKLDPDRYWLLTVAMMRQDSKLLSYQVLSNAMALMQRTDWQLIVVGDGPAENAVRACFENDFAYRVHFIGKKDGQRIVQLMRASDLFVWPAINEALGMVALEALSCGLPALCGRAGGIDQIVQHNRTGVLVDDPDSADAPARFASAAGVLLDNPSRLSAMRQAAMEKYISKHQLQSAAQHLKTHIAPLIRPA